MDRLRKRRDFLAAAKARRAGLGPFLIQGRDRADAGEVRIGLTVTKKTGNAVVRNRIRRRLREAARQVLPEAGLPGHDYVLVARPEALKAPFAALVADLRRGIAKLHDPKAASHGEPRSRGPRAKAPQPKAAHGAPTRAKTAQAETPCAPTSPAPPAPPTGSKPPPTEADRHE